jgi:hypothetical protein
MECIKADAYEPAAEVEAPLPADASVAGEPVVVKHQHATTT